MDLRIVNTCNNNCLYCLEQSYRGKDAFIDKDFLFKKYSWKSYATVCFYGWNPLLHPHIWDIVSFFHTNWASSVSLLSNSLWISPHFLQALKHKGLTGFSFYFNSFHPKIHSYLTQWWISLSQLIKNIEILQKSQLSCKCIIHVNKLNISYLARDIGLLYKKYWINRFEFINYFPFDRAYDKYHAILAYDSTEYENEIQKLFLIIRTYSIKATFRKFPKDFFLNNLEYYNFELGIIQQISLEDKERLSQKNPVCFIGKRCKFCFIKDNCPILWTVSQ